MAQNQIDWSSFRKRILINTSPEKAYHAWAVPDQIMMWFLETAEYSRPDGNLRQSSQPVEKGDRFSWKWHNWDFHEKGEILIADGSRRVSFTFGSGGIVEVEIKPLQNQVEILLTQKEIPTDEVSKHQLFVGCSTGWTFWLANLKAWLEHGITLHAVGLSQDETADLVNS